MEQKNKSRQQRVLEFTLNHTLDCLTQKNKKIVGLQASTLAEALGLNRANVSRELNVLYKSGELIKLLGKPTLFLHRAAFARCYPGVFIPTTIPKGEKIERYISIESIEKAKTIQAPTVFPNIKDASTLPAELPSSLHQAFYRAWAALLYPPNGLPLLITGNPGTGKYAFIKTLHQFAISRNRLMEDAPFFLYDCQEFQNAPSLFLAQLFGEKNSSSGKSRRGLLERAAGGILCLTHIEFLSHSLQEKLSLLLESGHFSRIGEPSRMHISNARIIAISSLPEDAPAIKILSCNIPIHITMPDLENQSLEDLLGYIVQYFQLESCNAGISFRMDKSVLYALSCATYSGNLRELKSTIKSICALAYQDFMLSGQQGETISISNQHLPPFFLKRIANYPEQTKATLRIAASFPQDSIVFSPGISPAFFTMTAPPLAEENGSSSSNATGIPLILVFHGNGIAEHTAAYINQLHQAQIAEGISFLDGMTLDEISSQVGDIALRCQRGNGVLIVFDMEPLSALEKYVVASTGIQAKGIAGMDIPTLLSISQVAKSAVYPVQQMKENLFFHSSSGSSTYIDRIVDEILTPSLTFLNPRKAVSILLDILSKILHDLGLLYSDEIAIKFIFHCAHMLERLIRGDSLKYDRLKSFTNAHGPLFPTIENRMQYLANSFGVIIPASELAYISELFTYTV